MRGFFSFAKPANFTGFEETQDVLEAKLEQSSEAAQSAPPDDAVIYRMEDLERIYGAKRSNVERAMVRGEFPLAIKLVGKTRGWWRKEVEEYYDNRPRGAFPNAAHPNYHTDNYLRRFEADRDAAEPSEDK